MSATPIIEIERVTKTYGQGATAFQALKGVDFAIDEGDFVAVMGPSGSGKSTIMNILGCLDTPTSGVFRFMGVEVQALTADQRSLLRRRYLGFVFQGFNLLARTTALENVELPLLYRGEKKSVRREAALEALDKVGLVPWAEHTPAELSGGQQQRVSIARALISRPEVVFADEPTGALDRQTSRQVLELLRTVVDEQGQTIVMVTHDPLAASYAHSVLFLADGQIVGHLERGTPDQIAQKMNELEK